MQNKQVKPGKGRQQLVLMLILFLIPPISAWLVWQYLQANGVSSTNNAGSLVNPARPLPKNVLVDAGGAELAAIKGRWRYVIFADQACAEQCEEVLHLTRQTRLSTNKDMQRVRRVLIVRAEWDAVKSNALMQQHPDLVIARIADTEQGRQWKTAFTGEGFTTGGAQFFLVDPIGNLMMYYDLSVQPRRLLKDLTKLLKVSQIG